MKNFTWLQIRSFGRAAGFSLLVAAAALRTGAIAAADDAKDPAEKKSAVDSASKMEAKAEDSDAAKYSLKYKLKPGEKLRYRVAHVAMVETTIQGTTQTADTSSTSVKAWQVEGVDDAGRMTFEHRVDSVDMKQKMSGRQEVRYNSTTDAKAPLGYEDVAKAVGVPLSVVTIESHGAMTKRVEKHSQPAAAANSQIVLPLPTEPVPVGHVWTVPYEFDVTLEGGGTKRIKSRQRLELSKVEKGIATILIETQILTPVNDPKIQVQLIQRLTKGHLKFDLRAGRITSQQMQLDERVLGFAGGDSSMHYQTRFSEQLLAKDDKTVAATKPVAAAAVPPAKPTEAPKPAAAPKQASPVVASDLEDTIPDAPKPPSINASQPAAPKAAGPKSVASKSTASKPRTSVGKTK